MEIKIITQIDDLEFLGSGTIQYASNQKFVVTLADEMVIRIEFTKDTSNSSPRVSIKADEHDANSGCINIINFNNGLSPGILPPMLLGDIKNRELYLGFTISSFDNDLKNVTYTFYLGKNIDNGNK